jgi:anti-sigma B factor antagonist
VLIDAAAVEFIDSSGLGVLVFLLKQMGEGGRIVVAGARPAVRRLFQITKLDGVFQLSDSLDEATLALGA